MNYFYVHRTNDDSREGWIGPIRSERQADREALAWIQCDWHAAVYPSTSEIKAAVREWQRAANAARDGVHS